MEEEIWMSVFGYEGYYEVSNLGRLKSLSREMYNGFGFFLSKDRILKTFPDGSGYLSCLLSKDGKKTHKKPHQLVAIAFLNHKLNGNSIVVDHINGDKIDNRLQNLQIKTHRENNTTCFIKNKLSFSSEYVGVSLVKRRNKWVSQIFISGKSKYLGTFKTEIEAHNAYQTALKQLTA